MIYFMESACETLNISKRHLQRLAERLGKKPAKLGTRSRYLFTEKDLKEFRAARAVKQKHGRKVRLPETA